MASPIPARPEPIPGYRLLEFLGRGGFGEVWKTEAPGGLHKAVKIVYGNLEALGPDGHMVAQELKALSRVKTVRHPYILSLERYDIIDGQLFIVMELADCNLEARFQHWRAHGRAGIPRKELLRYMEEAAEALDLMNVQHQLQHLDIKPQNLFLVGNHIKVADFGLVKDLEGLATALTGGGTPIYAAPETFEHTVSRFCDQYSLAIVYQEMLTGKRPFSGTNPRQLLFQHLQVAPDLSALPPSDRPLIARALSKKPADRYPSCAELVEALRHRGSTTMEVSLAGVRAELRGTVPAGETLPPASSGSNGATPSVPSPGGKGTTHRTPIKHGFPAPATPLPPVAGREEKTLAQPIQVLGAAPVPEQTGDGVLVPALVLGLGGFGRAVVQRLRAALEARFGAPDALGHLRLLAIDTDAGADANGSEAQDAGRTPAARRDVLVTRLNRPNYYLRARGTSLPWSGWLRPQTVRRIPQNLTAGGVRALGRLAFFDSYPAIVQRLHVELSACTTPEVLDQAAEKTGLGMRSNWPRVYVVTSLAGGTGSGMFLDLAYTVRRLCRQLGYPDVPINGVLHLAPVERRSEADPALANTMAALTELHHFSSAAAPFTARYSLSEDEITDPAPPFRRCILLPQDGPDGPAETEVGKAAGLLLWELTTPLGRAADSGPPPETPGLRFDTIGSFRLAWPRTSMARRAAHTLSRFLVHSWTQPDHGARRAALRATLAERGVVPDWPPALWRTRLETACAEQLGQPTEALFSQVIESVGLGGPKLEAAAQRVLEQLEPLVGRPGPAPGGPSAVRDALEQAGHRLLTESRGELSVRIFRLIEESQLWLAGAEEALADVTAQLQRRLEEQQERCRKVQTQAAALHGRIQTLLKSLRGGLSWLQRLGGALPGDELVELLRIYPRLQYQHLLEQQVTVVYQSLLRDCPEHSTEISLCRRQLQTLAQALEAHGAERPAEVKLGPGRRLLPAGCDSVRDSVSRTLAAVEDDDLVRLDRRVQSALRQHFHGLRLWCGSRSGSTESIEALLRKETEAFLQEHLGATDAGALFLARHATDGPATLAAGFDAAVALSAGSRAERVFLTVPAQADLNRIAALARGAVAEVEVVPVPGADDLIFYRQCAGIALGRLPQTSARARAAYDRLSAQENANPHARGDLLGWCGIPQECFDRSDVR